MDAINLMLVIDTLRKALGDKREQLKQLESMNVPKDTELWMFTKRDEDDLIKSLEIMKNIKTDGQMMAFDAVTGEMV